MSCSNNVRNLHVSLSCCSQTKIFWYATAVRTLFLGLFLWLFFIFHWRWWIPRTKSLSLGKQEGMQSRKKGKERNENIYKMRKKSREERAASEEKQEKKLVRERRNIKNCVWTRATWSPWMHWMNLQFEIFLLSYSSLLALERSSHEQYHIKESRALL